MDSRVSLKECSITHTDLEEPRRLDLRNCTAADRRRSRLRRGVDRWHLSVSQTHRRSLRQVLLIALTFRSDRPEDARGAIQEFWHHYRRHVGRATYFSWAELQMRGAVHYHAIVVNPPWRLQRHARRWVEAHWPHAGIQPSVSFRDREWFLARGGDYVKKYAKDPSKRPGQSAAPDRGWAQHEYELLPREIRTFESNQLDHLVAELDRHLDGVVVEYLGPISAPWYERLDHYWLMQYLHHHSAPGGCRIPRRTRKRPRTKSHGVRRRNGGFGGANTKAPGLA